jgi:sporulation protein YlmC with PRC-barrel domain
MRKISKLLSVLVLAAMILAACGGEETSTSIPTKNVPPTTVETTATSAVSSETATEAPTEATTTTTPGTSGIPVTGQAKNSDRISNELKFAVLDQNGKQVGKVDDIVLDLSTAKVLYVIVSAEKKIPVPWAFLKVGTASTNANANGQQNAFILQTDTDTFKNAPAFDIKNMPELGAEPDSWDISFRKYWNEGGAAAGNNTPSPAGTAVTDTTATATTTSNSAAGTAIATSTSTSAASPSQGTGTGQGATSIQGVQLASKVLNAKLAVGVQVPGLGTSTPGASGVATGLATSTPSTSGSTGLGTSTPSTSGATGLATSTASTAPSVENLSATITDMIVNTDVGDILYLVIKTSFDDGEHLIPVPLGLLRLDSSNQSFVLNLEAALLQNAPFFQSDQFPDMTLPDWSSEFDSFWQNNGSGGTGSQVTPTP